MSDQSDQENTQENQKIEAAEEITPKHKSSFLKTLLSGIAALFGIQSQENLERDFKKGSATHFIIIGIILVFVFIFTLIQVVSSVLDNAGM